MIYGDGSEFLETDDVNWLHIILPWKNLVEDIIGVDLIIFDDTSDLKFFDLADDRDLFGFVIEH